MKQTGSTRELWVAATIEANGWGRVTGIEVSHAGHATFLIEMEDSLNEFDDFADLESAYWEGKLTASPPALQGRVRELQTKTRNLKELRKGHG